MTGKPILSSGDVTLSPVQRVTFERALDLLRPGNMVTITQGPHNFDRGLGATTVIKAMQRYIGGDYVDVAAVLDLTRLRHPRHFEQSTFQAIREAMDRSDIIYLDRPPFGGRHDYNRHGIMASILRYVAETAKSDEKRVVFASHGASGGIRAPLPLFQPVDYAHLFGAHMDAEATCGIDFDQIHDHASFLHGHRIVRICGLLRSRGTTHPTTREVIEASAELMGANIDLSEVEPLDFNSLKGFEGLLRRLDRSILMPLREPKLARALGIETKRGVLLHGPPGTGKTSIGRALAHQMQGRFFMINGDYNHEMSGSFYDATSLIFDMAKRCTPSVIFIDDADVILGDPAMQQWGRFLLTMLDGLHSQSAAQVCVMMTAMNVQDLPQALLRSGRMELWLEIRLPDAETRKAILRQHLEHSPLAGAAIDLDRAASLTEDFTPADLRSVIGDIAGFLAYDQFKANAAKPLDHHFARAASDKRSHKALAAAAHG